MIKYNDDISYIILENGYDIYLKDKLWITQHDEYSKLYLPTEHLKKIVLHS